MAVRVLIVDDSGFFRKQIEKLVDDCDGLEVIDSAATGKEAVEKAIRLKPDVITMDIEMPEMNGIDATREIMRKQPTPILIFSSFSTEGAQLTLDALDAGAVDYMAKRFEDISRSPDEVKKLLCEKILDVARHSRLTMRKLGAQQAANKASSSPAVDYKHSKPKIIAIGTSTGGPVALQKILKDLPANIAVPILLVQHMPSSFTTAYAKRLDQLCQINVKEAEEGDVLTPGTAYLAPGGNQMTVVERGGNKRIHIDNEDLSLTYKPSVDITFSSLVDQYPSQVLAIILTGMGADGCEGAKKLKQSGSSIWSQDEETCVVYGMPSAVANAGITEKVLPLQDFSANILQQI